MTGERLAAFVFSCATAAGSILQGGMEAGGNATVFRTMSQTLEVLEPSPVLVPTRARTETRKATLVAAGNLCCKSEANQVDVCSACYPGSAVDAGARCATSAASCEQCAGTWCAGSEPSTDADGMPARASLSPGGVSSRAPTDWVRGTWTTGYWDCCKPSCAWPGKGNVTRPARSCDASGAVLPDPNTRSVCDGGTSASCPDYAPFVVNASLAMGFTAAAVSGDHGLRGDENCGQCFELKFIDRAHDGGWGGAHPDLVGKSMVVQVTNIGYDVTGDHSFDIQIPSAGQGIFATGCTQQFPGHDTGDFDCDNRYGGCPDRSGCARLPEVLQAGCEWRFGWYRWFASNGQTNNPYVDFRRVRCPAQLTDISGSIPNDDSQFPPLGLDDSHFPPSGPELVAYV